MSLLDRLRAQIAQDGPISVAEYVTRCLHDPRDGYYATRPALGEDGDFLTAPAVSQMFGELIGLWILETWTLMGRPAPVRLVEIGPGDGTLISDILRAARLLPEFLAAADLWLVEVSPPLRRVQAARLANAPVTPRWADRLEAVPAGAPLLLVANEVLDCLPAHQFVRTLDGWAERMVGLDEHGNLAFGLKHLGPPPVGEAARKGRWGEQTNVGQLPPPSPLATPPPQGEDLEPGVVVESSPAQAALGSEIGHRVARDGGAALLIDYGRDAPGPGDTLQALKAHTKVSPLDQPGQADLTVWADFPAVLAAAAEAGAVTGPILPQGAFLQGLGIDQRAQALAAARPDQADKLARQLDRLTGAAQMGQLFKAVCLSAPGLSPPLFEGP
ncbi:SAM-dependent MidA family methyltransferase [Caulobacter rhizosphaerae]|uniref:SAM-dependent MidA family methyltransferase n=1 Tax=Caulobacter rhizosphaerae TaxID=2010972 RepID=A0ABU1N3G1_9CAUL|nr:SAM-dependent methyltransferase [Caulobacter rhizosphaerae]MDR6532985.1 SAM-dependent MidA family methyltransferase [Caulobacter rhizosphaerae]